MLAIKIPLFRLAYSSDFYYPHFFMIFGFQFNLFLKENSLFLNDRMKKNEDLRNFLFVIFIILNITNKNFIFRFKLLSDDFIVFYKAINLISLTVAFDLVNWSLKTKLSKKFSFASLGKI